MFKRSSSSPKRKSSRFTNFLPRCDRQCRVNRDNAPAAPANLAVPDKAPADLAVPEGAKAVEVKHPTQPIPMRSKDRVAQHLRLRVDRPGRLQVGPVRAANSEDRLPVASSAALDRVVRADPWE